MPSLTRRSILGALVASGGLTPGIAAPERSLGEIAALSGRWFGAAARPEHFAEDTPLRAALLRECTSFTPELALKWAAIEGRPGQFDVAGMDRLADIARGHRRRLHGHALLWHRSIPGWARERLAGGEGWALVDRYLAAVMRRYAPSIASWDVVNEPIAADPHGEGLRESPFLTAFGPSYIRRALARARFHTPRAMLAINEFGLDYDSDVERRRRGALLRLVEDLRGRGAPLDQVGVQAHLDLAKGPFDERVFADFLRDLAATGVRIAITELDVKEVDYIAPAELRDRRVADLVGGYLDVALANPAVVGVTTWGLSDAVSWLEVSTADIARFPGAWRDGSGPGLNRGLPFDADLRRKPMYDAIRHAFLRAAPVSRAFR